MLNLSVKIEGEKVIIGGLQNLSHDIQTKAIPRGLSRIASGTAAEAIYWLQGPARGVKTVTSKKGNKRAVAQKSELAGGYPVPRVSKNLLNLLGWLKPGSSKTSNGVSFATGAMEVMVFDSAEYASVIHEGKFSSAKYGRRPFIDDAFKRFNEGERAARILDEEIEKEIAAHG